MKRAALCRTWGVLGILLLAFLASSAMADDTCKAMYNDAAYATQYDH